MTIHSSKMRRKWQAAANGEAELYGQGKGHATAKNKHRNVWPLAACPSLNVPIIATQIRQSVKVLGNWVYFSLTSGESRQ